MTPSAPSSGWSASIPAWSGRISTRPEPESGCGSEFEALVVAGEGLGRSRGGVSTKIHLMVDGRGLPIRIVLPPGQSGDNPQSLPLLDGIRVRRIWPGRPRSRPDAVIADKAYSHPSTRMALRRRGVVFVSPERDDRIARRVTKGSRGGRPPVFDAELYERRNVVERCFHRLKQFRGLATRCAKRMAYYQVERTIAAIVLWVR